MQGYLSIKVLANLKEPQSNDATGQNDGGTGKYMLSRQFRLLEMIKGGRIRLESNRKPDNT